MNIIYLGFFFAFISSSRQKNIKAKFKAVDCANLKCPPVDDPVCVKIKYKNSKSDQHVIAVNKCEIKYATCQKDIEAVIVPMVECHNTSDESVKYKRNKRAVDGETNEDFTGEGTKLNANEDKSKVTDENDDDENDTALMAEENKDEVTDENYEEKGGNNRQWVAVMNLRPLTGKKTEENEAELADDDGNNVTDENNTNEAGNKEQLKDNDDNPDTKDGNEGDDNQSFQQAENTNEEFGEPQKLVTVADFGKDYDQREEEADLEESRKDCPTVCPSRDVMVCAKCKHQIHRTFLSACHLRKFACQHKSESKFT
ncbi:hypothetical protein KGM_213883 [Danaus plexippus plexippus]|uniref:Uncharacterized protein n=1 Tax=Danaus plexippus plexippus TaxID=278856 RepID=A0A212F518_DANPL|nr:hypothetical protein KGM_213883 [Danaus plexippus plexippus]